jgi:signal transduction histidine kinase
MVGIGVLLLLLVVIQIVWLGRVRAMERKETDIRVMRALNVAARELEGSVSCFEAYSKVYVSPGDKLYLVHWRRDALRGGKEDTLTIVYNPGGFFPDTAILTNKGAGFPYPTLTEVMLNFRVPETETDEQNLRYAGALSKERPHTYKDIILNKLNLSSIINTGKVDSVLLACLKGEQVDVKEIGYGFSDVPRQRFEYVGKGVDTGALAASAYSVGLFNSNQFLAPRQLNVVFSGLHKESGFIGWLLLSVLIILLVSLAVYLFLRRYMEQNRLSQLKTDFINNLSHEFNTPMANIELAVETLSENGGTKDEKTSRILNILSLETHKLRGNIERSLQVATLEQGKLPIMREPVDLVPLINAILSGYQSQCEQLGGGIAFTHPESAVIYGDEVHLLNAVCNLLDNAIKYRRGAPAIAMSIQKSGDEVQLQVADKGIGMSQEVQRHIFEKFYRAQQGDVHNTKGFGLGLNYVQGIVTAHGGHIQVRSKAGAGSTFTIHLPVKGYGAA